jgi:hypothetical protein
MVDLYDFIIEERNFRKNSRKAAQVANFTEESALQLCGFA